MSHGDPPAPASLAKIPIDILQGLYKLALGKLARSMILKNKGKHWQKNFAVQAGYWISFLNCLIILKPKTIAASVVSVSGQSQVMRKATT